MTRVATIRKCFLAMVALVLFASTSIASEPAPTPRSPKKIKLLPDKKLVAQLCTAVQRDGQLGLFLEVLQKSTEKEKECYPCTSFYKAISTGCRRHTGEKKGPKGKQVEVVKKLTALDPSTELLDVVSKLFVHLREERELLEQKVRLVRRLSLTMAERYGRTPQQRYYLQVLSGYIKAPFRSALQAKQLDANLGGSKFPSSQRHDPGEMFE